MSKKAWIDVETGGGDSKTSALLQIAVLIGKDSFVSYVKPPEGLEIEDEALEVNGITREQIKTFPSERRVFLLLKKFLDQHVNKFDKNDKLLFCGYNSQFDTQFVRALWDRQEDKFYGSYFSQYDVDTFALVKRLYAMDQIELHLPVEVPAGMKPNLKLGSMCNLFGIDMKNAHDALADIKATKKLDKILVKLTMKKAK